MWVADMDFACPSCVTKALAEFVDTKVYGYHSTPDSYYQALIDWQIKHNGLELKQEWLRYSPGIVTALYTSISAFTDSGDKCLILTPCYYPFFNAVEDTGREVVACALLQDEGGRYEIDFYLFEQFIKEQDVKMFLFCTPHNPVGRVWSEEEISKLVRICKEHSVTIVSDEIHSDIIMPRNKHMPTLKTSGGYENTVMLIAASKTFNLAGCNNAYIALPSDSMRKRFDDYVKKSNILRSSSFGYIAVEAAFRGGEEWLKSVIQTIHSNCLLLKELVAKELPMARLMPLEGTYLCWLDLKEYIPAKDIEAVVIKQCKLGVDFGSWFFGSARDIPDTHIRLNIATSSDNIRLAVKKLTDGIAAYHNTQRAMDPYQ